MKVFSFFISLAIFISIAWSTFNSYNFIFSKAINSEGNSLLITDAVQDITKKIVEASVELALEDLQF